MCFDSMFSQPQSSNSEEFRKSSINFDSEINVIAPARLSQKASVIEEPKVLIAPVIPKRHNQWLDEWLAKVHHGGHFGKSMVATILPSSNKIPSSRSRLDPDKSLKIPEDLNKNYDRELLVVPAYMTDEINDRNLAMGKILYSPSKSRSSRTSITGSQKLQGKFDTNDFDSSSNLKMNIISSELSKRIQQQPNISQSVCEIPQTTTSSISSVHSSILHSVSPRSSHSNSLSTSVHSPPLSLKTDTIISSTNYLRYNKSPASQNSSSVSALSPPPPSIRSSSSSILSSRNKHIQHNYYHLHPTRRQQDETWLSLSP